MVEVVGEIPEEGAVDIVPGIVAASVEDIVVEDAEDTVAEDMEGQFAKFDLLSC